MKTIQGIDTDCKEWSCQDCGTDVTVDLDSLISPDTAISIKCDGCNKRFMMSLIELGNGDYEAFTYQNFDGQKMYDTLNRLLKCSGLPFSIADTMAKNAKIGRWHMFFQGVKRYKKIIMKDNELSEYLKVHEMLHR